MTSIDLEVLLINVHSSRNAGDAALTEMAISCAKLAFPGATITLAMNEPDYTYASGDPDVRVVPSFSALCGAERGRPRLSGLARLILVSVLAGVAYRIRCRPPEWLPADLRPLLVTYMRAGVALSKPGNVFATMGRIGMPFLLEAYAIVYALALRKPLYVLPQSIGPLRRQWERTVVRRLFSQARQVFVREPLSLRLAEELQLPAGRLHMTPDMAFALPQASSEQALEALAAAGVGPGPRVGVTVVNRLIRHVSAENWERYEAAIADALSRFAQQRGVAVVFFPQVIGPTEREDDRVAARRIMARMAPGSRVVLIEEQAPPSLLKAMYGQMDVVVATRMHSAIFALSNAAPTLLIEYLHKIRGLAEMLEMEQWTLSLAEVDVDRLGQALDALWEDREAVRRHLEQVLPDLVRQVGAVSEVIARDFYTG